jgi:hypothetical protein
LRIGLTFLVAVEVAVEVRVGAAARGRVDRWPVPPSGARV